MYYIFAFFTYISYLAANYPFMLVLLIAVFALFVGSTLNANARLLGRKR